MRKLTMAEEAHIDNLSIMNFNKFYKVFENGNDFACLEENLFYEWLIDKIKEIKNDPLTMQVGTPIFRSRIISEEHLGNEQKGINLNNFAGYNDDESREPPLGMSKNGRCNICGTSYFYGADNEYTALCEVRPAILDYISLAKFEVSDQIKIADISKLEDTKYNYFCKVLKDIFRSKASEFDITYKISQYISEMIRKYGFDGIKYQSSLSAGNNFVIFNSTKDNLKFINSEIVCLSGIEYSFNSLCRKKEIEFHNKNKVSVEKSKKYLIELSRGYKGEK